jgi:hypothetical protein
MTQEEIEKVIAGMSEADQKALLATEFPEEIEKEAAAEAAQGDLVDALYAYGALTADIEVNSAEGELSKEASAEFEAADTEISEAVEAAIEATGLDQMEDEAEMHKHAQAAAAVIFEGYVDQMDKLAKIDMDKARKGAKALGKRLHGAGKSAWGHIKKHKGAYMAGAGGAALGAGGAAVKNHMDKKASDLSKTEMAYAVIEQQNVMEVVADGVEKLAAKAGKLGKAWKHVKAFAGKHKHHAAAGGAGAAGAMAGYMAARNKKAK